MNWNGIYGSSDTTNPQGASSGTRHVVQGSSWYSHFADYCIIIRTNGLPYNNIEFHLSFRVVLEY